MMLKSAGIPRVETWPDRSTSVKWRKIETRVVRGSARHLLSRPLLRNHGNDGQAEVMMGEEGVHAETDEAASKCHL